MLATYMRSMHNNNLEIRIAGDKRSPQKANNYLRGAPTQAINMYFYLAAYQVLLKSLHFIFVGFESVI